MSEEGEKNRKIKARKQREVAIKFWGGKCYPCGEDDSNILEFHHRDPSTKVQGMSYMWGHATIEKIYEELDKCDLLCKVCHAKEGWKDKPRAKHGTRSRYVRGCRCDECKQANRDYAYEARYRL
jgi:hypothetical protein